MIHETFEGDTFFPEIDWSVWEKVATVPGVVDEKISMHMTMKRIIETINNKMKGVMSNADIERKIIQESQRLGIDKIGFTHAEPFIELEDSLHEQRARI